ncbi:pentapeptide repeat-containing protein [Nodosilinea sp. LEGE 06152]|uniref:pentapeptide repeat-containing protein n=2 Tax=Nodosilinea sp. LEGE 06152 TaxID=2777966 RepID=UPI00188194BB|nr:pentapeptide repeat-containing protein [Nodosilinea sp. LEGE 06152]MBE9160679.1 pentapeptide repeat-containing protein [Nodosilinea sp. LEGE 06152]
MLYQIMLSEKQQVWLRRHLKSGIIVGVILAGGLLVVGIRADNWAEWTGLGKGETTSISTVLKRDADGRPVETETKTTQPGKTLWDWLGLLGVPLTLAILGYVFQQQERYRAETLKEQDQYRAEILARDQREIAANEAKEEILQAYFDRLSSLLIDKNIISLATNSQYLVGQKELLEASINVIRARTLSILRRFEGDPEKINSVIRFLRESEVFSKANLKLDEADLIGVNLKDADLREIPLSKADLKKANLARADLEGANLEGANLTRANLAGASLEGANIKEAYLMEANFARANLARANLAESGLAGADLREAFLLQAKLTRANLRRANLTQAICFKVNLASANLEEANLRASFQEANLEGANLQRANLAGALLEGANLQRANLQGASLQGADFKNIKWDDATSWPNTDEVAKAKNIPEDLKQQQGITDTPLP